MTYQLKFEAPASTEATELVRAVERGVRTHLIQIQAMTGSDPSAVSTGGTTSDTPTSHDGVVELIPCHGLIGHKPGCYKLLVGKPPYDIVGQNELIGGAAALFIVATIIGVFIGKAMRNKS